MRLKIRDARVARWHAPSLDPREADAARPPGKPAAPELRPPAAAPAPTAEESAAAAAALEALRTEKAAAGHAEGLARGLEEGRAQGRGEGHAAGQRVAEAEAAAAAARFAKAFDALGGQIKALDDAVEDAVVALALELARRVVGAEVARSREALAGLIRQVLKEVPIDTGTPRVLLHPDDLTALRTHLPDIGSGKVELVADETIEAGGCRVLADGIDNAMRPDRRWIERSNLFEGDLTLAARWRAAMLALFD
ncbi:MAG: FliH/SctL family protein [Stellaceae bacterium]